MIYRKFSKRQLLTMTWWNRPGLEQYDGIICDGAVRSGKTVCMADGFFLWSMSRFRGASFAICGRSISSLQRNIVRNLYSWLGGVYQIREQRSQNLITVSCGGHTNYYYLFGGQDESSYANIQGITLAGVLLDEVALMPRSFVEQACARCSVPGSKMWFNCNPAGPEHWFYKEWLLKRRQKNLLRLHFTMQDNPGLQEQIRQRYEKLYTGIFYRRYVLGQWCLAVECTYRWNDGVQLTAVTNLGNKAGFHGRKWKKHGKLPYVTYEAAPIKNDPARQFTAGYAGVYRVDSGIGLKLRTGAGTDKQILQTMPDGSRFTCYGYHTGQWLYGISATGQEGFCHRSLLREGWG